ncbi:MAG: hypothetical protein GXP31_17780 [Kiritimatiellaeota bacterium]|nr:hypothetical protein [Kiritimatiellota bacterium]
MRTSTIIHLVAFVNAPFLMCGSSLSGAEYYVSNSGNDDNPGTTPAQAWRSLAKVNAFRFAPGDVIRFEKGGVWRGQLIPCSGSKEGHVTYTSYGTGPKPQLLGAVEKNKPSDWEPVGKNIWQTGPFPVDVGSIIFNNGAVCGFKVWEDSDLDKQDKFCFGRNTKMLKVYSVRNPAEMYEDIECALKRHIINESGRRYVVYDGLHLAYGAAHGIGGGGTHHIIVRNCDLCFIGGGRQFSKRNKNGWYHVRYGNGVEFWGGAHDNLVEGCRIWDIYDAGVTNQGASKNQQYNIIYRNNIIWNCEYSFEYWNRPETSVTHDIYFENNLCFNAGRGWSDGQPYKRGRHLSFARNRAQTYNFYVRKNVFHYARSAAVIVQGDHWNGRDKLVIDNNLYYQPPDRRLVWWGDQRNGKSFLAREFHAYQKFTGKDRNSRLVTLDTLIVRPGRLQLRINETEPVQVTVRYSDGATADVTPVASYSLSDAAVASIQPMGTLKGLQPGKAVLTVSLEELTATTSVKVTE